MIDRLWRWSLQLAYWLALVFWFIFRPRGRGVMVAVWFDRRILIIQNSYKRCPTFPGGGLLANESARQAAARELAEEVGLHIPPHALNRVGRFRYQADFKRDRIDLFEVELNSRPALQIDHREVTAANFQDPRQAQQMTLFPVAATYLQHRAAPR